MRELTKETKLKIIDTILSKYVISGEIGYLCYEINNTAISLIDDFEFEEEEDFTERCLALIPEFIQIKPDDVQIYSPRAHGWFGIVGGKLSTERRIDALKKLKKIIEN
jgi:hypothetical protein